MSAEPLLNLHRRGRRRTNNSVANPAPVNEFTNPVAYSGPDSSADCADPTAPVDNRSNSVACPGPCPGATVEHGTHTSTCRCPSRR